eukprot:GHUV01038007.1.p1 GENE.GHUV01038007.1~~GHUV01038007.1.p1  ORF type:complete len:125 (+),score=63.08 GHUV01038007.1:3-377(+)
MGEISAKLRDMRVSGPAAAGGATAAAAAKRSKPASDDISSLHDAAKWDDVDAARRLLESGADVNQLNERGVSPLGVAVGFNRKAFVEMLLDAGADIGLRDAADNTVLHYAAGEYCVPACLPAAW